MRIPFQLRERRARRLEGGELPWRMGPANHIGRRGRIHQRQAWQALQQPVLVQHLAAFAPGCVHHHQAHLIRSLQARTIHGRCKHMAITLCCRVQQHDIVSLRQGCLQCDRLKGLAHQQAAIAQTTVQQPGAVLCMLHFLGMLQDQHLDRMVYRRDPLANARALRALACSTDGATGERGLHQMDRKRFNPV